jgi:hypothetical protein
MKALLNMAIFMLTGGLITLTVLRLTEVTMYQENLFIAVTLVTFVLLMVLVGIRIKESKK